MMEGRKMKKLFLLTTLFFVIAFGGISAAAQCDRNVESPIKCGYYDEGYQDGVQDANRNRSNDYHRYRNKFESQYENFYSRGYSAGYDSVRPSVRWTNSQRSAYDSGYTIGQNDRRNGGQRRGGESPSYNYDPNIGLYFQQGYDDGFNNRPRTYDVPLSNNPPYPGGGGSQGTASWSARVDDRANIIIRGGTIRSEDAAGTGLQVNYQNMNGSLPRRATIVSATRRDGRGDVRVIQQPSRTNDYTAIIQVVDSRGGSDNYTVDISWTRSSANSGNEPYRSGSVRWRGRVDQTADIIISGSDVQTQDAAGTGLSGVTFNITGYLAARPGSVTARKRNGRGSVTVKQLPSWENDFTAIVQVFDPGGGADDYEVDINW